MDGRGRQGAEDVAVESNERPLADVLKDVGSAIQRIVQSEIKLAKIEITESVRQARSCATAFGTGGILGIYALGFLLLTVMFALEIVLPNWLAALIVGMILMLGAGLAISSGRERLKSIRAPHKTIQTVKEDLQWMKEQSRS